MSLAPRHKRLFASETARCEQLWSLESGSLRPIVRVNPRLRRARGRCVPASRTVELRPDVTTGSANELRRVFCHELAHLAVHRLYGPSAKPHGQEWRALMQAAGYPPVASLCRVITGQGADRRLSSSQFEHRCPVCQMVRLARRRVSAWRCANCVAAGLPGELIVTRQKGRASR